MDIRHFLSFKTIVDEGSFIKAAQKLNYAQSSITSHIRTIEEYYGQPVFDRIGKKIVLNAFGKLVYDHAVPLLSNYDDVCKLKEEADAPTGKLRIGVPESTMLYRLSPILKRYKTEFPQVEVVMLNTICPRIRQELKSGELDVGILLDHVVEEPELICKPLFVEPMSTVLPKEYPADDLVESPGHAILYTEQGCSYRSVFTSILEEKGIKADNTIETASVEVIKHYVLCNLGISFLPKVVFQKELDQGLLKHVPWQSPDPITVQIVLHKDKWISPAMEAFIRFMEEESQNW